MCSLEARTSCRRRCRHRHRPHCLRFVIILSFPEPSSPHSDGVLSVKQDALWSHQLFHGVCSGSTNDCLRLHFLPFTDLNSSPYSIASAIINIMRRLVIYPNRRRFLCILNIFEACACARGNRHYVGVCGQCYCNGGSGMSQSVVVSL